MKRTPTKVCGFLGEKNQEIPRRVIKVASPRLIHLVDQRTIVIHYDMFANHRKIASLEAYLKDNEYNAK